MLFLLVRGGTSGAQAKLIESRRLLNFLRLSFGDTRDRRALPPMNGRRAVAWCAEGRRSCQMRTSARMLMFPPDYQTARDDIQRQSSYPLWITRSSPPSSYGGVETKRQRGVICPGVDL